MNRKAKAAVITICLIGLFCSLGMIIRQFMSYRQAAGEYDGLTDAVVIASAPESEAMEPEAEEVKETAPFQIDFHTLRVDNPDIIGWVYCPALDVSYPILQGDSNDEYLRHLWTGEYSVSGSIFMDYRNACDFSDANTVIYGHNMKDGSMFAGLDSYKDQAFYDQNPVWYIMTPEHDYKVNLFAGYVTAAGSEAYTKSFEGEDWLAWTADCKARSVFQSDIMPGETDRVVTFSTCAYSFQNARFVLHGVLEELYKPEQYSPAKG